MLISFVNMQIGRKGEWINFELRLVLELDECLKIIISKGTDFFEHWICFNIIAKK